MAESKTEIKQKRVNKLLTDELKTKKESLKILKEEFGLREDMAVLINNNSKATKRQADTIGEIVDATKTVLENEKNITEESLTQVDLQKLERKLIREGVKDTGQIISKLKEKQRIQERTNNLINRQANMFKSIGDKMESIVKSIPGIGGFLSDFFGVTGLGRDMEDEFRNSLQSTIQSSNSFGREAAAEFVGGFGNTLMFDPSLGKKGGDGVAASVGGYTSQRFLRLFINSLPIVALGGALAIGISDGLRSMSVMSKIKKALGGSAFTGVVDAFGDIERATLGNILGIKRLGFEFGVSAENSAKLLQAQTELTGLSDRQARQIQLQISSFARLRNVLPKDVISDIADNTELFAKFSKDGGMNIGMAAVEARKLGLSLSTVENISSSLLNFQSSIESELEASLLIGRQLNLNKARELALAGDLAGVQREVVKQIGSEAELNRLNVIQRKKLAEALGITAAELGKLAGGDVEIMSSDVSRNTIALNRLSSIILGTAIAGGGNLLLGQRSNVATNIMKAKLASTGTSATLARAAASGMGFFGGAGMLLGGIVGLTALTKLILDALNKGNENTTTMARNSNNNNFRPFISAEPISN
jgi:hypothetical protein